MIDRQINLIISTSLSKQARAAKLAAFAKEKLQEAQTAHRATGGRVPPHETIVDQRRGAMVESVRPDGEIVFEFEVLSAAVLGILDMLQKASPVLTGDYRRAHLVYADGIEVAPTALPAEASEFVILNAAPYARAIERGISAAAPAGVYQVASVLAQRRYGNIARIRFSFRSAIGGNARADRAPAIIISARYVAANMNAATANMNVPPAAPAVEGPITVSIDARNSTPDSVERLKRELPGLVIKTM